MLQRAAGLGAPQLAAVADLERRVVAADGGRLKLEWGTLRARSGDRVEDLLWWDGDRLAGFLGLYSFGAPAVELAGMVDPERRRQGIATALVDAALPLCQERAYGPVLLVTARTGAGGHEFALARGGVLDHSEHALELRRGPAEPSEATAPEDDRLTIRAVDAARDGTAVDDLLRAGFGWERPVGEAPSFRDGTLVVERDGEVVGTVSVAREDLGGVGIYGFVVRPDLQGRGIGRGVLRRLVRQAVADGAGRVHLDVEVGNDRALGLYTSVGFRPVATEDYYTLPTVA